MKTGNIPTGLLTVLIIAIIFATAAWLLLLSEFGDLTNTLTEEVKSLEKDLAEKAKITYGEFFVEFCQPVCYSQHASGIIPTEWNKASIDENGKGVFHMPYDPKRTGVELIKHWTSLSTSSGWDKEPEITTEQENDNLVVRVTLSEMKPGWVGVIVSYLAVARPVAPGY